MKTLLTGAITMGMVTMNKLLIALLAFSVFVTPAIAGSNQFENWKHNRHAPPAGNQHHNNQNNNYHHRRHHGDGNNYWHGNHNNNFYNDPNFWGGVAGGLIGGAIIGNQYNDQPVGPGPGCYTVLQPVAGPNYGVVYREVILCN